MTQHFSTLALKKTRWQHDVTPRPYSFNQSETSYAKPSSNWPCGIRIEYFHSSAATSSFGIASPFSTLSRSGRILRSCQVRFLLWDGYGPRSFIVVIVHEKKRFLIPIFVEDGSIEVKVHDLPPRMPNHMIEDHLQQYGEIISIHDEVWRDFFPGVPNGVRVVRMKIQKPIPSFVKIEGLSAYIAHKNQIKTCRYCTQKLHAGQKCKGTNYNEDIITTSNEDQEEHPEKTTEPEKKTMDNTCDLIFSERRENKEQYLNTSIDLSNEKGNPQQTTNVSRKMEILSKKKAIVRLAQKKRIL
ncbi:conserved hypothetical protein [Culex quinquefasciatus]|uniref:Uncharacterized protein n=1 Tax=Culex quinquefasciatus TaxID=7176 RepID=B0XIT8_CULQU|nr:conserved hypothetical protein [Culex quinquefasciatus]|eukprot:XP_001869560.1 conserved hypothetical protein [Culex quinquefasciatus]